MLQDEGNMDRQRVVEKNKTVQNTLRCILQTFRATPGPAPPPAAALQEAMSLISDVMAGKLTQTARNALETYLKEQIFHNKWWPTYNDCALYAVGMTRHFGA